MIETRLKQVREAMAERDLDAFLSLKLVNTFYLSGFTSLDTARPTSYVRPVAVVVDRDDACLIVPLLDEEAAAETSEIKDVRCYTDSPAGTAARALIEARLREIGARRVGIEQDAITSEWTAEFTANLPGVELVSARDVIERLRMRKDDAEIETLRRAAQLADAAVAGSMGASRPGVAELEAETDGIVAMRRFARELDGKAVVDCIPMVLGGPRSSMPHEFTTAREFLHEELMWHCWLVSYQGYWVENIRTGVTASESSRFSGTYDLLVSSLEAGQDAARVGAVAGDVYRAVRGVLTDDAVDGGVVLNRSGHGMGLEYQEPPFIEPTDETEIEEGMVLTVEPGIWIAGVGGLTLSNTLVVRPEGPEILTRSSTDLYYRDA